jgi:hypothetical protein
VVDGRRVDLLGAHVLERADALGVGLVHRLDHLRDAEVHDLDAAVLEDHDVLRLQIAVDHRRLLPVRCRERIGGCGDDGHGVGPAEATLLREDCAQRASVEELEHHHELASDLEAREAAYDVRVLDPREDLHLVEEEPARLVALRKLRMEDLEGDAPLAQPLLALVDLPHPTLADQPSYEVIAHLLHALGFLFLSNGKATDARDGHGFSCVTINRQNVTGFREPGRSIAKGPGERAM